MGILDFRMRSARATASRRRPGYRRSPVEMLAVVTVVAALPYVAVILFPSRFNILMSRSAFLSFHNVAEFFSSIVLFSVFGVGWFTHDQSKDRRSLFLACTFLTVGLLDLMHMLSFSGMPNFITVNTPTKGAQYWVALRFLTAASFLASAFMSREAPRWISKGTLLPPALVIPGALFVLVNFFPKFVPVLYDPARGLTPLKVHLEYAIVALFLLAILAHLLKGRVIGVPPSGRIIAAIVLSIYGEMVLTTYRSVFDIYSALGHVYNLVAFCLVYQDIFTRSVREPYLALTAERRTLKKEIVDRKYAENALRASEQKLALYLDQLEVLVEERTAELRVARDESEKANRAKSAFLASMSHELRTPLNAVLGFSELMRNDSGATLPQRQNLDIISRSGEHLLTLINNVLDISKIESGRVELVESPLDLRQLMQEITSLMSVHASGKGLGFALEQSPSLPRLVVGDEGKLRQVLINLLGNAIKFTERGGIILRAGMTRKDASGRVSVRFEVVDTGPGIREEEKERIFSPFVQAGGRSSTEAGSGLGLAICRQYVQLMGGEINVTSGSSEGSIFYFEIPVEVLSTEVRPVASSFAHAIGVAEGQPCYRILIAEDQLENRLLLRRLLEPMRFELREAVNGAEAVTLCEQWRPHLVFMDIRMPVMDGLEAIHRIKATDAGTHIRIVAITAHAFEEEQQEVLAVGCDGFIRKPYRDVEIFDALAKHLGVRFIYEKTTPVAAAPATSLSATDLAGLPDELLTGLEHALVQTDIGAVGQAIEGIRVRDPQLADALAAIAHDLQFGRILRLIRAIHDGACSGGEV